MEFERKIVPAKEEKEIYKCPSYLKFKETVDAFSEKIKAQNDKIKIYFYNKRAYIDMTKKIHRGENVGTIEIF